MKIFETIIKTLILNATNKCLDPLQFVCQSKLSLDCDTNCLIPILCLKVKKNKVGGWRGDVSHRWCLSDWS